MDLSDLSFLFVLGIGCLLLVAGINWLVKWDYRKREGVNQKRMYVPTGLVLIYGVFGVAGLLLAGAGASNPAVWTNPDNWLFLIFLAPGIALIWLAAEYRARMLDWDKSGVQIRQMRRPVGSYTWGRIVRIDHVPFAGAWRLWFDDGRRFHLPERMIGLEAFMISAVDHPHIELRDRRLIALRDSFNSPDKPI